MPHYQLRGDVPRHRHTQHRDVDGRLRFEELMGEEGFSSDSSLLYHREIPSALLDARAWDLPDVSTTPNEPLLPRHLVLPQLFADGRSTDVVTGRRLVLGNDDVRLSYVVADAPSPLYRNAVGDEAIYVESGSATVETVFGPLEAREGDFVMLPRATTHRWLPHGTVKAYCIEANSHLAPPHRYLSRYGQLLEHAPYCERDLHAPAGLQSAEGEAEIYVKHRGSDGLAGTIYVTPTHPFDVIGWDGCLYPYTFNVADFMPITGKVHQPPPVHQVFEGANLVICAFVPRRLDYHPLAIPVPYYHSNVDSDEVMFYCGGSYEARRWSGIGQASVSLHPGGHSHGPQPGAYERSIGVQEADELAIMVDTFRPLRLGAAGVECDDGRYAWSWAKR
ncbi:homogentisate 1,2-dioxygenase domain-containing protein [Jatrophihabitans sp.]|uniref:homogentisate 1,2-dioxygenase n=1 Tax=Jatrophihabitans sp. TaxID=1932789 RepID=UPI0030C716C6|nr:hmgA [Jatrophihabitans sp.]